MLGRGGAGFPAGVKWGLTPQAVWPRYLVVNGDESEPGTYKDRLLMERDPHQLIEGALIACYAVGLQQCFLYVRGEMALAQERVAAALNEAYAAGYIGRNILGTDFSVDVVLTWGAGAYVVGEETALIESLEGNRGMPRLKPPYFPAAIGLYGQPTIVNNVETLANLPWLLRNGAAAYTAIGTETSPGHAHGRRLRSRQPSGRVRDRQRHDDVPRPHLRRRVLGRHPRRQRALKTFVPGGGSAPWFLPEQLDLPFEGKPVGAAGSMLGSGAIIVMDETTDIPERRLHAVAASTPTSRAASARRAARAARGWSGSWPGSSTGRGTAGDLDRLLAVGETICPGAMPHAASDRLGLEATPFPYRMTTICFVGPSAYVPVHSALTLFREEFEAKIKPNV